MMWLVCMPLIIADEMSIAYCRAGGSLSLA